MIGEAHHHDLVDYPRNRIRTRLERALVDDPEHGRQRLSYRLLLRPLLRNLVDERDDALRVRR